jgi:CheY-like chemotaxis protein
VAKILVADDNSNIQRMVGLALKDQGIDVVAVGNGEAAVRKISELHPDLVLADVFMPVRNGYEVCQYVKEDSSLAHIPVILLVGAFDPLDEQEAQRVGADGVLKKPFVPPDPLIAMVKAALQRAGIELSTGGGEKTAPAAPRRAADLLPPAPIPAQPPPPPVSPLAHVSFSRPSAPEPIVVGDESFVDEPEAPVSIDSAKHTMAFGSVLGSAPATANTGLAADDADTITGSDWRSLTEPDDVPEEEEEEEPEPKDAVASWRRDGAETVFQDDPDVGPVKDWRDSEVVQTAGRQSARETWDEKEKKGGFVTAAEVPEEVGAEVRTEVQASVSAERSTDMGAFTEAMNALETDSATAEAEHENAVMAGPSEQAQPEFSEPRESSTDSLAADKNIVAVAEPEMPAAEVAVASSAQESANLQDSNTASDSDAVVEETESPVPMAASEATNAPAQHLTEVIEQLEEKVPETAAVNSWFSRPASPWDTDSHRMNPLAETWETKNAAPASEAAPEVKEQASEAPPTNGQSSSEELATVIADDTAAAETSGQSSAVDGAAGPQDMDALVAKVLSRISPDVLQAVTRELLKPMVAAILEDELKSKK